MWRQIFWILLPLSENFGSVFPHLDVNVISSEITRIVDSKLSGIVKLNMKHKAAYKSIPENKLMDSKWPKLNISTA